MLPGIVVVSLAPDQADETRPAATHRRAEVEGDRHVGCLVGAGCRVRRTAQARVRRGERRRG